MPTMAQGLCLHRNGMLKSRMLKRDDALDFTILLISLHQSVRSFLFVINARFMTKPTGHIDTSRSLLFLNN